MPRQTDVSKKALEIYGEILPHLESGEKFMNVYEVEEIGRVHVRLRQVLNEKGWTGIVQISESGGKLYVGRKRARNEQNLRKMVRRLAAQVDDDRLYEEAMALVGLT